MSKETSLRPGQYVVANVRTVSEADGGAVRIAGVANDASITDTYGTRITFTQRALDGFKSNPILLFNHDIDNPIGTVTSVEYRGTQLWAEAEIHPDARTPAGASIAELTRAGVLRAFSVRFDEFKQERASDHIAITAEAMDELSVVTLPSNKPSLFSMRSKGVDMHGAEELMDEPTARVIDARQATTRAAGPLSYSDLAKRLSDEIRELNADRWDMYCALVSIYDDYCIHMDYVEGTYFKQGYTVDADGNVSLTGAAVEVLPSWVEVNTAGNPDEDAARSLPTVRLNPDDLSEIVRQVREAVTPIPEPEAALPVGEPEAPAAEAPAELSLEDVRSAIRQAAQSVTGAQTG